MRRVASHYLFWHRLYRMHYVELDDKGFFSGVYPLDAEIAGTEFYDGIVVPILSATSIFHNSFFPIHLQCHTDFTAIELIAHKLGEEHVSERVISGVSVQLLLLSGITLTTAELGTNYRCCNGYVKRL